ncbi:MAG TPA: glycoside hydrolase family 38 C-terminal domain-containing protein [Chthonomonadaceae bacterium]|nr:glycoside hydrolase family 38 C-terminal domain-containing protein [Chthonomonadaceae bacterium]
MKFTVHYVPHTHYDAEVFLTREETFEIGYSVLLGALAAMRQDPQFKFVLDQTCYIEPFLKTYPEERAFFEQMIAEGRLEITCGMHAMPDVNIPSGESFIRQVMAGKFWCERELGLDVRCGWLLDTFGQHPQIPQLMRKCGFDHNVFQRIGTFDGPTEYWWQGLDGSKLFCHWMRSSYAILYPAPGNLHEFKKFADTRLKYLKQHALTPHLLALSGADLAPIQPHVTRLFEEYNRTYDDVKLVVSTPREYFDLVKGLADFPTLEGDLNPVFQGCYSARIAVKQWNRRLETLLGNAEFADAFAALLGQASQGEQITQAWEGVLFNQFHDIICGSHVDKVYANTIDRYKASHAMASRCLEASLEGIAAQIDTTGDGVPVVVFNPLSWDRDDVAECAVGFSEKDVFEVEVRDSSGRLMVSDLISAERYETGGIKRATVLFVAKQVPSLGYEVFRIRRKGAEQAETSLHSNQPDVFMAEIDRDVIENEFCRLEIDAWNGAIRSLVAKGNGWEVIPEDRRFGNTVVKELDNGNFWEYNGHCKGDAFLPMNRDHPLPNEDSGRAAFSHHYGGDGRVTNGRARVEYNVSFAFGKGFFATRVRLYAGIPRVEIQTTLVNEDERVRYRAACPTTLANGIITQEIPFGAIERPQGEFPAQNWVDYSGEGKGIALLNKGLPGNNVDDGVLLLSLLKCTALKEGYGEVGGFRKSTKTTDGYEIGVEHTFEYALVPHAGDWRDAKIYRQGMEFNRPLLARKVKPAPGRLPQRMSLFSVSADNVVISAVRASPAGTVVRVYEAEGRAASNVVLRSWARLESVEETNLIEKEGRPLPVGTEGRSFTFDLGPFEIKTFVIAQAAL